MAAAFCDQRLFIYAYNILSPTSQHYHYPHLCTSVVQSTMLAQAGGKPDLSLFVPLKELWRCIERLLCRAIVLTAQVCDIRIDEFPPSASVSDSQAGASAQTTRLVVRIGLQHPG